MVARQAATSASNEYTSQIQQVEKRTRRRLEAGSGYKLLLAIASIAFAICGLPAPPPPKICGTLHGPSVTAPSIRLADGRPVAYASAGTPLWNATHKLILVHDYGSSRLDMLPMSQEQLGVFLLSFDRAGYGESHPHPHRSVESEASDIEQLADELFGAGAKFYVVGIGVGAYAAWGCLKYIPHRLKGVAIVAPVANFWWPGLPSGEAFAKLSTADRNLIRIAHYAPGLLYWWTTQKWFPVSGDIAHLSTSAQVSEVAVQQGVHESLHRDLIVQFGSWKFDPTTLKNHPAVPTHLWHSSESLFFPAGLQRQMKIVLPWIKYHDAAGQRHQLVQKSADDVLAALLASQ